jgi:hypothetical protein
VTHFLDLAFAESGFAALCLVLALILILVTCLRVEEKDLAASSCASTDIGTHSVVFDQNVSFTSILSRFYTIGRLGVYRASHGTKSSEKNKSERKRSELHVGRLGKLL